MWTINLERISIDRSKYFLAKRSSSSWVCLCPPLLVAQTSFWMEHFASDSPQPAFHSAHSIASLPYSCPLEHPSGKIGTVTIRPLSGSSVPSNSAQCCIMLIGSSSLIISFRLEYNPGRWRPGLMFVSSLWWWHRGWVCRSEASRSLSDFREGSCSLPHASRSHLSPELSDKFVAVATESLERV